jgi:hypothetical protein
VEKKIVQLFPDRDETQEPARPEGTEPDNDVDSGKNVESNFSIAEDLSDGGDKDSVKTNILYKILSGSGKANGSKLVKNSEPLPFVIAMRLGGVALIGVAIIIVSVVGAIVNQNVGVLKISALGLLAFCLCALNYWQWVSGAIVKRYVTCLAVTRYMGGLGPFNVTFVDNGTGKQYVAAVDGRNCPYANGVRYIIYTSREFDGRIIAYEDTEFDSPDRKDGE